MKFHLEAKVTISARTVVEADTLEAAIKIAAGRATASWEPSLNDEEVWICDDVDGTPFDIESQTL
ncbi:hypothetical protein RD110_11070 [Rhodoferax koreense]|uniref:Uncharacterized protein n=1 Tax=Rhodoferax koreensis TaxID=1842727 RepID=A0A1P8JVA4_9BURK|nr:hypothetical protein [Rhodoferax koreense]APW37668.1 hypothetical protein RD110_11070 [Rhodoferax koreense]